MIAAVVVRAIAVAHQSRRCFPPVAMTTSGGPLQAATRSGTPVTAAVQAVAATGAVQAVAVMAAAEAMMVVAEETVAEAVEVTDARDLPLRAFDTE